MSIDCRVASAVVLLGSLALVPSARAGDPPLFPCQELTFEGDGDGAAHADWNGDGNLDVAITGLPSTGAHNFKGVTLFFGDGLGNFPTKITRTLPTYSRDVAAADVDGDGRPDLMTLYGAGGGPGGIEVAKNGPLGLGAGSNYVVDEFPTNLAAGDVTNDGRPDLVCSTGGLAIVDVLVNDGTGAFPTLIQKTGVVGCKGIALDDFDQNGDLDFAVTQFNTGTLETTYYGDGAGAFPRKRSVTSPNVDHSSLCAGDFNADGFPDVAVGDGNGSNLFELRVLINNGLSGTTNGFASMAILSDTSRIYCVRTDDIDFDGKLDLVVESDGIEVRRGLGGGAFDAPTRDDPVSIYKG
ncbi:MAG TPA: VCBS repeat-containing protein, partial [Pirellulaceae bacterium]|nr:VCBS repeat-containing protein [Pirellulaceae bacterium]